MRFPYIIERLMLQKSKPSLMREVRASVPVLLPRFRLYHPFLRCNIRHLTKVHIRNQAAQSRRNTAPVLLQCQNASMSARLTRKTTNTASNVFRINRGVIFMCISSTYSSKKAHWMRFFETSGTPRHVLLTFMYIIW